MDYTNNLYLEVIKSKKQVFLIKLNLDKVKTLSKNTAKKEYINLVEQLKVKYGF